MKINFTKWRFYFLIAGFLSLFFIVGFINALVLFLKS